MAIIAYNIVNTIFVSDSVVYVVKSPVTKEMVNIVLVFQDQNIVTAGSLEIFLTDKVVNERVMI